jgi:hypothetical protein
MEPVKALVGRLEVLVGRLEAIVGKLDAFRVSLERYVGGHWARAHRKTQGGRRIFGGHRAPGGCDAPGIHRTRAAHRDGYGRRDQSSHRRSSAASVVPAGMLPGLAGTLVSTAGCMGSPATSYSLVVVGVLPGEVVAACNVEMVAVRNGAVMVAARSRAVLMNDRNRPVVVAVGIKPVVVAARNEAGAAHNGAVEGIVEALERCEVVARRRVEIHARGHIEIRARRRNNRISV